MCKINDLPKEIMLKIWNSLEKEDVFNCLTVNQSFHSFSISNLWRYVRIQASNLISFVHGLHATRNGDFVQELVFFSHGTLTTEMLEYILLRTPNLKAIHLYSLKRSLESGLLCLPKYCKKLEVFGTSAHEPSEQLVAALSQCSMLRVVDLLCESLPKNLWPLVNAPIKKLTLLVYRSLTIDTMECVLSLRQLEHFTLKYSIKGPRSFQPHMHLGASSLFHLKTLVIHDLPVEENDGLVLFLSAQSNLREIILISCHVTDNTLNDMALFLPELHSAQLIMCESVTACGIRSIIKGCEKLEEVEFIQCSVMEQNSPQAYNPGGAYRRHHFNNIELNRIRQNE